MDDGREDTSAAFSPKHIKHKSGSCMQFLSLPSILCLPVLTQPVFLRVKDLSFIKIILTCFLFAWLFVWAFFLCFVLVWGFCLLMNSKVQKVTK